MLALSCVTKLGANEKSLSGILEYWKSLGFINYTVCVCVCVLVCVYVEAHVSAQHARKRGADVFFCKWGEEMRMRIMSKSFFFLQKRGKKTGFRLKVGVCVFFLEGLHKTLRGINLNGCLKLSYCLCKWKVDVLTSWKSQTVNWLLLTTHEKHEGGGVRGAEERERERNYLISGMFFCLSEIILYNFSKQVIGQALQSALIYSTFQTSFAR